MIVQVIYRSDRGSRGIQKTPRFSSLLNAVEAVMGLRSLLFQTLGLGAR
jgi:hypothetical protein